MRRIGRILGSRVDFKDGYIVLPPKPRLTNMAVPSDIYAGDATQKYPIGTKLYMNNGKTYRYCKAGATISTQTAFLKINGNYEPGATGHENVDGFEGALYAAGVASRTYVDIADTTARAAHYYEGAELVLQRDADNVIHHYYIYDSDVGDTTHVRVYIPEPGLKQAYAISGTACDAYMNEYSKILSGIANNCIWFTAVGAFDAPMTSGYYYWLLTKGKISLSCTDAHYPGQTASRRRAFANTDGSVTDTDGAGYQEVGYVLGATVSGYGSICIMLTLDD